MTTPDRTDGDGLDHFSIDWALEQLCAVLGVRTNDVIWDAATETVDGDVRAVIGNILRVKYGENWSAAPQAPDTGEGIARLSASEVACYRWPEDTAEHRAMRAAFGDGAAHIAKAAPPKPAPDHADDFGDMPSAYLAARSSLAKPAPDALREALDREEKYLVDSVTADCDIMPGDVQGSFHRLRSLLSPQSTGDQPQVKPDREALIHTICPHIRQYSDSHWQGNHACLQCPATVKTPQGDAVQRCRRDAERAADDVIRCWQSTGDQQAPQVSGASTPAVVLQERSTPNKGD